MKVLLGLYVLALALAVFLAVGKIAAANSERVSTAGSMTRSEDHSQAYWRYWLGEWQRRYAQQAKTIAALRLELAAARAPKPPPRPEALVRAIDGLLSRYGSPMAGNGQAFVDAGCANNVNPRLAVAISGAETTFGRSDGVDISDYHNAWGWGPHKFVAADWPTAIALYTAYLSRRYVQQGLTTIAAIEPVYVGYPSADWSRIVPRVYAELGGNPDASVAGGCS